MSEMLPGAEPQSWAGGPDGVLVLHGFTGSPQSMRPLAQAFADAGFTVELPLLPGHGTSVEDMLETSWTDWRAAAEAAFDELAGRRERVVVAGLSMGGTLATWLAASRDVAGLVVVNPAILPQPELEALLLPLLESGQQTFEGIGNDVAKDGVIELAYPLTPIVPLISLGAALEELQGMLGRVECPVLICTAPEDHVVPPASSDHLATSVKGPVERVTLERSYHVATLDHDAPLIEERAVAFAKRVCS